jgi:hypothetical protein
VWPCGPQADRAASRRHSTQSGRTRIEKAVVGALMPDRSRALPDRGGGGRISDAGLADGGAGIAIGEAALTERSRVDAVRVTARADRGCVFAVRDAPPRPWRLRGCRSRDCSHPSRSRQGQSRSRSSWSRSRNRPSRSQGDRTPWWKCRSAVAKPPKAAPGGTGVPCALPMLDHATERGRC